MPKEAKDFGLIFSTNTGYTGTEDGEGRQCEVDS
jgi:hypothetical protein